ncbi:MAG: OstA-like protein, partial [Salinibacter sp.]
MSAFPPGHVRCWTGRVFVLSMFALVLVGSVGENAWAQAVGDTARAAPTSVEPAGLDSLPGGALAPPYQAADSAAADTGAVERAYVEADSLSTFQRGGEQLQELFGHVFVRQDTTRIRSEYALRYLNRDEVLFVDDVVIYQRGDTLRADTVRYNRATEVGHARGHVRLTNGDVQVRAERATYYAEEKRSVFPDSVTLVDSSRVLRAHHGTYWSDEERAEFGGGVRLTEPGMTLFADSLTYYRREDRSIARGNVFLSRQGKRRGPRTDTTGRTYLFG